MKFLFDYKVEETNNKCSDWTNKGGTEKKYSITGFETFTMSLPFVKSKVLSYCYNMTVSSLAVRSLSSTSLL